MALFGDSERQRLLTIQALDPATLADYRKGLIPEARRAELAGLGRFARMLAVVAVLLSAAAAGLAAAGGAGDASPAGMLAAGCGAGLLLGLIALLAWIDARGPESDARAGLVQCAHGAIQKSPGVRAGANDWITVGGIRLCFEGTQHSLFCMLRDGAVYRVYFLPRSRIVVAIEPAEGAGPTAS